MDSTDRHRRSLVPWLFAAVLVCQAAVAGGRARPIDRPPPLATAAALFDSSVHQARRHALDSGQPVRVVYRAVDALLELEETTRSGERRQLASRTLPTSVVPGSPDRTQAIDLPSCGDGCFAWTLTADGGRQPTGGQLGLTDGQTFLRLAVDDRASGIDVWIDGAWVPFDRLR